MDGQRQLAPGGDRGAQRASRWPGNPPRGPDRAAINLESLTQGLLPWDNPSGDAALLYPAGPARVASQLGDHLRRVSCDCAPILGLR